MPAATSPEPFFTPALLGLIVVTGVVDAGATWPSARCSPQHDGDVVFIGFAAAGASGLSVARSVTALAAFFVGAVLGGRMAHRMGAGPLRRWTAFAFGGEAVLFLGALAAASGQGSSLTGDAARLHGYRPDRPRHGPPKARCGGSGRPTLPRPCSRSRSPAWPPTRPSPAAAFRAGNGARPPSWRCWSGTPVGAWLLTYSVALPLALCAALSGAWAVGAFFGIRRSHKEDGR